MADNETRSPARARHRPSGFGQPSGADVWEVGLGPFPASVPGDDGQPLRPLVAMVVDSCGRIRASAIGHPARPLEALKPAIEMEIEEPQAPCLPGRPRRVVVGGSRLLNLTSLLASIDGFCASHLNAEYRELIHTALAALARKRPSPLLGGREPSWCAGVVHAIGSANFLFDKSQTPHCKPMLIYTHFGVSAGTGQAHSKKVRDLLRIAPFSPDWTLPSRLDNSPMAWMLEVNGFLRDVRNLPLEIQIEACAKGLIPYVPALRDQARLNSIKREK